jgi:hypothetical protein
MRKSKTSIVAEHIRSGGLILIASMLVCSVSAQVSKLSSIQKNFGAQALKESTVPIRAGEPGKAPFWNMHAHQFIYAPSFDYKPVEGAVKYRYTLVSENSTKPLSFENKVAHAPLSEVWAAVPVGYFTLEVTGLSASGDSVGHAGNGRYYRAAAFNGPYYDAVMDYDKSARTALDSLFKKDYVQYWFDHKEPDPGYFTYRYPAKIYSALVIGAITYAKLEAETNEAKRAIELANIVADYMLNIRFKPGTPWAYNVPTYYGKSVEKSDKEHIQLTNHFTVMGVDAGNAFLDLYDFTRDKKYLEAAKNIANTFVKNQMENGTWYQFVYHESGKPTAENLLIPTAVINYFDRLRRDYNMQGLEQPTAKAFNWIMNNPVKTFNWQGQFEDVFARPAYHNQSREQSCDLAIYLFKNKRDLQLAEDLVRFSEDQFVIWEKPLTIAPQKGRPGGNSKNWITPSVQEQYVFWMPVGRAAGIMIDTYWQAYLATKKQIYLAKAVSIANAFTLVQKENKGDYVTFFTKYPMNQWLNSTVYPAKVLMNLQNNLEKTKK